MSLEERIKHYQRGIDRITDAGLTNTERLLHIIVQLNRLPITVKDLQSTGVGRSVNALRKVGDGVGDAAKNLVAKWKVMVAQSTNSSSEEDEACVPDVPESYENEDMTDRSMQSPQMVINTGDDIDNDYTNEREEEETTNHSVEEKEKNRHKSSHSSRQSSSKDNSLRKDKHSSSRDKYESSRSSESYDSKKKDKSKSKSESSEFSHAKKRRYDEENGESSDTMYKKRKVSVEDDDDVVDNNITHDNDQSSEEERNEQILEQEDNEIDTNEYKKEKKHSSKDHSKDKKSSQKGENHSDKSKSKSKHHSSSSHSDKSKKHSSSKLNGSEKDSKTKSEDSHSKELKSKSSHSSSSSKNHSSKEKEKGKEKQHKDKESHDKHEKDDNEKSKNKSIKDKKHSKEHKEQAEDDYNKKHKEHKKKKHKDKKHVKKDESVTDDEDDVKGGIDGNSGTSFGEALGMCMPPRPKKKKETSASTSKHSSTEKPSSSKSHSSKTVSNSKQAVSPDNSQDGPSMLSSSIKLEPLQQICEEVDLSATLPEPCLNYRPLPQISVAQRKYDEDMMLSQVIHAKGQRTKVYSGNKSGYSKVPSLFDLCIRVIIENIDALDITGGVPYHVLKPALERATPDQLMNLECYNEYLLDDSDELWKNHCSKDFRTKKREEDETWREMYMRCRDEREAKFKALTANIKQSIDNSQPVRSTKLAYVDIVKPPRNIMRKQARFGTALASSKSSEAKKKIIAAALGAGGSSTSATVEKVPAIIPLGRNRNTAPAIKKQKAPLMMKTLQALKGRFKR